MTIEYFINAYLMIALVIFCITAFVNVFLTNERQRISLFEMVLVASTWIIGIPYIFHVCALEHEQQKILSGK